MANFAIPTGLSPANIRSLRGGSQSCHSSRRFDRCTGAPTSISQEGLRGNGTKTMINQTGRYLLLALRHELECAISERPPGNSVIMGHKAYADLDHGDWLGFYDWLRNSHGHILGVRFWPFEDVEGILLDVSIANNYITILPNKGLEIFFSQNKNYEARISGDQDFSFSKVYRSRDGYYALAFGMLDLPAQEVSSVLSACGLR